jgi:hypothetical protein
VERKPHTQVQLNTISNTMLEEQGSNERTFESELRFQGLLNSMLFLVLFRAIHVGFCCHSRVHSASQANMPGTRRKRVVLPSSGLLTAMLLHVFQTGVNWSTMATRRLCTAAGNAAVVRDFRKEAVIYYRQLLRVRVDCGGFLCAGWFDTSKWTPCFAVSCQEAKAMPTANRREFMKAKVKYQKCKAETNPEKIAFLLQFAEISVENARCHVSACLHPKFEQ